MLAQPLVAHTVAPAVVMLPTIDFNDQSFLTA